MLYKKSFISLFLVFGMLATVSFSQPNTRDSLLTELGTEMADSSRVLLLTQLSNLYIHINPDSATLYANEGLVLANQIDFTEGFGEIYAILGDIEVMNDNFS